MTYSVTSKTATDYEDLTTTLIILFLHMKWADEIKIVLSSKQM